MWLNYRNNLPTRIETGNGPEAKTHQPVKVCSNPMSGQVVFNFAQAYPAGTVSVRISDSTGKTIWHLRKDHQHRQVMWDGTGVYGNQIKKGIYFYSFRGGNTTFTGKIIKP
jgi:hypothetical protein